HIGDRCENACPDGKWRVNCTEERLCQNSGICGKANGPCKCPTEFAGNLCLHRCDKIQPMEGCTYECACKNGGTCNKNNGTCSCPSGYNGELCEQRCESGTWGARCQQKCDCLNENDCDPATGKCVCISYKEDRCRIPCPRNQYGQEALFVDVHVQQRGSLSSGNGRVHLQRRLPGRQVR
ncbi:hypothetical protein AAVH_16144, partial [Aphelenchoides avenae]